MRTLSDILAALAIALLLGGCAGQEFGPTEQPTAATRDAQAAAALRAEQLHDARRQCRAMFGPHFHLFETLDGQLACRSIPGSTS